MKKTSLFVLSGVAVAALLLSSQRESQAAPQSNVPPTGPTSTAIPGPKLDVPPSFSGFAFWGGATTKPNAVLKTFALEVPIRVSGTNPRSGTLHVKRDASTILNAPFSMVSGETKTIPLVDSVGLEKACHPAQYDMALVGSGFDVKKTATVTATCSFTSESANPWNLAVPDRVEEREANHVYFNDVEARFEHLGSSSAQIPATMVEACARNMVFKTTVTNHLKHPVSGMHLTVSLNGVLKASSVPFTLAAGQSAQQVAFYKFEGEAGSYVVGLNDPNNTAQGAISSSGYHVDVARSCGLVAALGK